MNKKKGWLRNNLSVTCVVVFVFGLCVFSESHAGIYSESTKKQLIGYSIKDAMKIEALTPDINVLSDLLFSRKYSLLDDLIDNSNQKVKEKINYEVEIVKIFDGFLLMGAEEKSKQMILPFIDEWIADRGSEAAHVAKGFFYLGIIKRLSDGKDIHNVEVGVKVEMRNELSVARLNMNKALDMNEYILPAYLGLISSAHYDHNPAWAASYQRKLIRFFPFSYYGNGSWLLALRYYREGSEQKISDYINQIQNLANKNPRLWVFRGFLSAESGRKALRNKDHTSCIRLYTEALSFGDDIEWLMNRAYCYFQIREDQSARKDLAVVMKYSPSEKDLKVLDSMIADVTRRKQVSREHFVLSRDLKEELNGTFELLSNCHC